MWMISLVGLLLLALGFAASAVTMRLTDEEPVGLADESVVALIEDSIAASNADDEAGFAAPFNPQAKFYIFDGHVQLAEFEFADVIAREMGGTTDLVLTSEVVQHGAYASAAYSEAGSEGVMVVEIDGDNIANQWIFIDEYK